KEAEATRIAWALTGGFAAYLLTRHFRGDQIGLFVSEWPAGLARRLKWLPSHQGPVTVLRRFSPLVVFAWKDPSEVPVAHPLLVYAELIFQGRERELGAAKILYDRYLGNIAHGN
ncbi:MAG: type IV toxin-antitoxin system AbiEi family antitoxin, partial [Anaerolineae bacterium]